MVRLCFILCFVVLLALSGAPFAHAETAAVGGCPDDFHLHQVMHHDDDHQHRHVGSDMDRNGDGWLCVKHVAHDGRIHVHIDTTRPVS